MLDSSQAPAIESDHGSNGDGGNGHGSVSSVPAQVRKRDGKTVQVFDYQKIENAIRKAWLEAEGHVDEGHLRHVAMKVTSTLPEGLREADVEQIQDHVEATLMRTGKVKVAKAYILYRQKRSEARKAAQAPDPLAVGSYIHAAKYARYIPEALRRELYLESIDRVEDMHLRRYAHLPDLCADIRWAFGLVREKRVLPSMRSMQFGGLAVEKNHNRQYNCSATLVDRLEAFSEAMFLLLSGCGVGYSIQFDHVEKLPALGRIDVKKVQHHVVEDTIEGWSDALAALLRSYVDGYYLEFSFHKIRPAGTPLKTSGGRAPGHLQLKIALENIRQVLHGAQGRKMRPVECHRVMCHAAEAVLSGGIRRSAMIALFSLEDSEMVYLKTGGWFENEPWLQNANNSVVLKRNDVNKKQFKRIFQMVKDWGEPGFLFCSDENYVTNPCVPAGTRILTREGYKAIEACVGKLEQVWNGEEWSEVTPQVTGHDQPMVRVHLSDGTYLDCTDYHEWCTFTGWTRGRIEERVRAIDLQVGDTLTRFDMPLVEVGADMPYAYTHGFWCGDGTVEDAGRKTAMLYGVKKALLPRLEVVRTTGHDAASSPDRIRAVLPQDMPDKFFVPENASVRSRLAWFSGLLDADSNEMRNPASLSLHVASINLDFLRRVRRMLTTLGVQAKIGEMHEAGTTVMPDGRGGEREFVTQTSYRLMLNATDVHRLVKLGLDTGRIDLTLAQNPPQRDARRFVTVASVERLPNADVVYCFTEPKNHTGTFEGIVTAQCAEIGLNPRLTIDKEVMSLLAGWAARGKAVPAVTMGEVHTGWALCNLCEINGAMLTSFDDFLEAGKAAAIIGTLQASYTEMPYLGWVSELIAEREALLGIGITGMLDAPEVSLHPGYQKTVAHYVRLWNEAYATKIGIRPAARTTCIKPSGTTSLELGCVASGHHAHHAKRYIRRVTADELEVVFQAFKAVNPTMCVRKPNGKWVIEFPVQAPEGAILKEHLGAIQFLDMVKSTQQNWVLEGTARPDSSPGLNHNVSNTVHVKPEEWDVVAEYLWDNRSLFTGVTLISDTSDKKYAFAPNESISTEADEARWNQLVGSYTPVDYSAIIELEDGTALIGEAACAGGACNLV